MATKKKAKKKSVKKKPANVLKKFGPDCCFVLIDGKKARNLPQLALLMDDMPIEVFSHHVNDERNDFANWIKDVIKDVKLADQIMGIKQKEDLQLHMLKAIAKAVK